MQSDSTTNCEEQMKFRHKTTLQFHAAAKQNDEEEINSYRKTTLHALDAAAKQNIYMKKKTTRIASLQTCNRKQRQQHKR
jgi:hypothetical protein